VGRAEAKTMSTSKLWMHMCISLKEAAPGRVLWLSSVLKSVSIQEEKSKGITKLTRYKPEGINENPENLIHVSEI
jgi:hypothetical protein